mmetsp:Transcript_15752/g.32614  ORF Transcript_15752/g.32614 Transcript_15752/m.32614 type:complete len:293 (-) Transcript_15752:740-1618(-)
MDDSAAGVVPCVEDIAKLARGHVDGLVDVGGADGGVHSPNVINLEDGVAVALRVDRPGFDLLAARLEGAPEAEAGAGALEIVRDGDDGHGVVLPPVGRAENGHLAVGVGPGDFQDNGDCLNLPRGGLHEPAALERELEGRGLGVHRGAGILALVEAAEAVAVPSAPAVDERLASSLRRIVVEGGDAASALANVMRQGTLRRKGGRPGGRVAGARRLRSRGADAAAVLAVIVVLARAILLVRRVDVLRIWARHAALSVSHPEAVGGAARVAEDRQVGLARRRPVQRLHHVLLG